MSALTIAGFAKAGGVGVETVRYYQRRGLLPTPARCAGGSIRRYGSDDVRRLRFIRTAQSAGFSLYEIIGLLAAGDVDDRPRIRDVTATRIAALDVKIEELRSAREALARLAAECSATTAGSCPIIAAFEEG